MKSATVHHWRTTTQRARSGLAPLELVLVLPLMMMVAGLMLFVANAAVWKLRSHGAAREAAFQQCYPRTGELTKPPPDWVRPDVATTALAGPPVWGTDPFERHSLFRGPSWRTLPVDTARLDGSTGLWTGRAQSNIKSGLWPQIKVYYRFQRDVTILGSQQWQYQAMGMGNHDDRRSKILLGIGQ